MASKAEQLSFLVEATKHNFNSGSEDRLTQIVSATFNSSALFRKIFLEFLDVKTSAHKLDSKTQVDNGVKSSRPDLIIFGDDKPLVLIESKLGAKADSRQQRLHTKQKCSHNFILVRDPVMSESVHSTFKKLTWFDFFNFIENRFQKVSAINSIDKFLIYELLEYGKESEMLLPDKILKSDLEIAADFFTQTRLRKWPSFGFKGVNPFKSLENIALFFERVLLKLREDDQLAPKFKMFTRQVKVGSLYYPDLRSDLNKLGTGEIGSFKVDTLTLEKEMSLKKTTNGFSKVFLRVEFQPVFRGKEITDYSPRKILSVPIGQIHYKAEIIAGLSDARGFFDYDDCILFEDRDLKNFDLFYGEATKHWKRSLRRKR